MWTDESTTPLSILEFSLVEVDSWMKELIRQVSTDVDFDNEDEQLKGINSHMQILGSRLINLVRSCARSN